jgi:hypothetical protein
MHGGADAAEMLERYVTNDLSAEERRNFEEHLMECAECFEGVQEMERFVAGICNSAAEGLLDPPPARRLWLVPAFAAMFVLALGIAGVSIWNLTRSLNGIRDQRDQLAQQLRQANTRAALEQPSGELRAGNLPLAILESSRAQTEQVLAVDSSASELALWIEVAPGNGSFAVAVSTAEDRPIQQVGRLKANRYGALAVVLPAGELPPGRYVVRLFGEQPRRLLGQYLLRITSE